MIIILTDIQKVAGAIFALFCRQTTWWIYVETAANFYTQNEVRKIM